MLLHCLIIDLVALTIWAMFSSNGSFYLARYLPSVQPFWILFQCCLTTCYVRWNGYSSAFVGLTNTENTYHLMKNIQDSYLRVFTVDNLWSIKRKYAFFWGWLSQHGILCQKIVVGLISGSVKKIIKYEKKTSRFWKVQEKVNS